MTMTPLPDIDTLPASAAPSEPQSHVVGYHRTPQDVFRSIAYLVIVAALLVPTLLAQNAILGFESDLVRLASFLSSPAERIGVGVLQISVGFALLAAWATPFILRRYRMLAYLAAGHIVSAGLALLVQWVVGDHHSRVLTNEIATRAGIASSGYPALWQLAQLAAAFVVLAPFVSRRWRGAGAAVFAGIVVLRIIVSVDLPVLLFLSIAVGGFAGAVVLLAFGRPDERPTDDAVRAGLRAAGLDPVDLAPASVDARGSVPYFGTTAEGPVFAKVLSPEERSADLLFRFYRYLRYRNLGDERPFSSLRREVEHEAFVSLQARDVGVRTPHLRAFATVGADSYVLAYERIDGDTLDHVDTAEIDDALLRGVWEQIALLRSRRIAHRDLRRANVLIDSDRAPWIIDFGFAEVAASDALLESDVAQFLAALSVDVGAERAVDSAIAALGPEAVAAALPRLQMAALSHATQTALRKQSGLLKELQQTVAERTGVEEIKYEPFQRLTGKQLFTVLMLILVTYFLLPQFADLPKVWENVKHANWWWFVLVLLASEITYLGAATSLEGSVPARLPFWPTFMTQHASSFVGKLAPSSLGGMALNIRFMQKSGVDGPVAVSGVGLNAGGGIIVHLTLMAVFIVWAGRQAFGSFKLPDPQLFLYGIGVVLVLAAVSFAVPAVRHMVIKKLLPILGRSLNGVRAVMRNPLKLALLIGGSIVVTMSYIVGLYFSSKAFGGELRFATVGAVYLAGSAVASAAPTPGGLGAVEAALVAGLRAAGMPAAIALPAVFLYRFGTFWIPILPGWACFTWLRKTEHV